ncbi:MAG: hypothetical protein HUN04_02005 [Desulfobacter sp.]|nr:MAG: hypothetical protein HUN04_02005 [Desulfobacter sp.]
MQNYFKRLIGALIFTLVLLGTAQAEMMQVTWTGIISNMRPEPEYRYGLGIGDEISVYAVYDDSNTEMHIYDKDEIIDQRQIFFSFNDN